MDLLKKFNIFLLVLVAILGIVLGNTIATIHFRNKVDQVRRVYEESLLIEIAKKNIEILQREIVILDLQEEKRKDSLSILRLKEDIIANRKETQEKVNKVPQMTKDEKVNFLINRYPSPDK